MTAVSFFLVIGSFYFPSQISDDEASTVQQIMLMTFVPAFVFFVSIAIACTLFAVRSFRNVTTKLQLRMNIARYIEQRPRLEFTTLIVGNLFGLYLLTNIIKNTLEGMRSCLFDEYGYCSLSLLTSPLLFITMISIIFWPITLLYVSYVIPKDYRIIKKWLENNKTD